MVAYLIDKKLYITNVGDSRAVMAMTSSSGAGGGLLTAKDLSRDHKPNDPVEAARIKEWGGFVSENPEPGFSSRVYLDPELTMIGLAMSRSIGE